MPKGGKMWSLVLVMGCGEKEDAVDTAESSVVSTPELDEYNECGGESVTGIPMGTVDCMNERCIVTSGPFWMGSDFAPAECPIHEVVLSTFDIDQYEVTLEDWQRCVNQGRCSAFQNTVLDHCTIVRTSPISFQLSV